MASLSLNERTFIARAAAEQQRVDGRRPFDPRKLSLRLGPSDGTAEVRLGHTRVLAAVSAELGAPFPDRPTEGALNFLVECPPMGHAGWDVGRPPDEAAEISRLLERTLRDTGAVDTEALCVLAGRAVWTVKVAVHVLDHDGAVLDAAAAAALAALLSFRLPAVTVGGDTGTEVTVLPASVKEPVKLNVHMLPLALSFAFISPPNCAGEELLLLDPCAKEAGASCAVLTISATPDAELCAVHKAGGAALPPSQLARAVRIAAAALPERVAQLQAALAAFEAEREKRRIRRKRPEDAAALPADKALRVVADVDMAQSDEESERSSSSGEEEEEEQQQQEAMKVEAEVVSVAATARAARAAAAGKQTGEKLVEKLVGAAAVAAAGSAAPLVDDDAALDLTAAVKPRVAAGKKKSGKR